MPILIKGGHLIDPANRLDGVFDLLIEGERIKEIAKYIEKTDSDTQVIEASGKIVTPGLIDMHVHLREPGHEYKETIATGCLAAVSSGFTAVCAMPNTDPVNDNSGVTQFILKKAAQAQTARVYPVGAISRGLAGEKLCEYGELKKAGVVALSDDGHPVANSRLMRRALEYARGMDLPLIAHCEDLQLAGSGVMNEGGLSARMGLPGIPNAAEAAMVMRDILLCALTRGRLHIAHVSTRESVQAIRRAKAEGLPVTAETAPHYFTLSEAAVKDYNTHAKMNPPLRSPADIEAIKEGLADGTIDVIATDHAPHSVIEKELEFEKAANGIIGLETSLPVSLKLVQAGVLSLSELINKMSCNPARILGLENGLAVGRPADITIIDLHKRHTIDAACFRSLSRNTPFNGWEVAGKAVMTLVAGKIVLDENAL